MLTTKQRKALVFISDYQAEQGGVSPSYDEIAAHMGLASRSGAHRLVTELEGRGFISRPPTGVRNIRILKPVPRKHQPPLGPATEDGQVYRIILRRIEECAEMKRMAIALSNRTALARIEGAEAELAMIRAEIEDRVQGRVFA